MSQARTYRIHFEGNARLGAPGRVARTASHSLQSARRIGTTAVAVLLAAFSLGFAHPVPGDNTVDVRSDSRRAIVATPGEIVSTVFEVHNSSDSTQQYVPEVRVPDSWLLVSSGSSFDVAANAVTRRVISFRVPAGSPSGVFPVEYSVREIGNPDNRDRDVINVTVGHVQSIDLQLLEVDDFVLAGESYTASFVLINAGNRSFSGSIRIRSVPDFPVALSSETIDVAAGSSARIAATVETEALGIRRFQHWIKLDILNDRGEELATANASIDVLPAGHARERPGTIPASIRFVGFESYRGRGGQVEFKARGPLREETSNIVDLFIRTPDHASSSLFARRDEYRLTYASESFTLRLGDQNYALSPLTEYGRLARGAGVELYSGPMTLGAFASRNRNAFPREDAVGVLLGYDLSDRIAVSANFIDKSGQTEGQTISIRTRAEPIRNSTLDLEVGDGGSAFLESTGVSARASGSYDLFSYDVRHLSTSPGFPGVYQNYSNTSGSVQLHPTEDVSLMAAYQIDDRRFKSGGGEDVRSIAKYIQAGPGFEFGLLGRTFTASARYAYRAQNAVSDGRWTTRNEQQLRLRLDLGGNVFSFGARVDVGSVSASTLAASMGGVRIGGSMRAVTGRLNASAYFDRFIGATIDRAIDHKSANFGVTADYRIAQRTDVGFNVFTIRDDASFSARYSLVSTRIQHRFGFGHLAGVQTNLNSFGGFSRTMRGDLSFYYEIPIGIPSLRADGPRLSGRVVDFETGEPLEGVVLRLGRDKVVTNAKGDFRFRWESDTRQYLFIDQSSIGLDRVPMIPLPLTVTEQALADLVEIPVARAGELFGTVRRYEYADGVLQEGELRPTDPVAGAVVEAADSEGSYRTTTDGSGRFQFTNLRPGSWQLRIVYGDFGDDFRPEVSSRRHELSPAERMEVDLRVVPRKRRIRFIGGGRVAVGDSAFAASIAGEPARDSLNAPAVLDAPADTIEVNNQALSPSTEGDLIQAHGRDLLVDQSVANRIRLAFEEALRVASGLDSTIVQHEPMPVPSVESVEPDAGCSPADNAGVHEVRSGETLAAIARRYYCDVVMWPKVWLANYPAIQDPHVIYPGQQLAVPVAEADVYGFSLGDADSSSVKSAPSEVRVTHIYTVGSEQTLFSIAKRTLGSGFLWPRIWLVNRALVGEETDLVPGTELIIPGPERLRVEYRVLFGQRALERASGRER
ncbi:MAG: LysM peptidoglycan-binding domain-containing protein [Rhodothermales bacterium]